MGWLTQSHLSKLLIVLLATGAPLTHAEAQSFGKVSAVNLDATGTPPRGAMRTLTIGTTIVVKERVRTSAAGSTQILFPDQSTLNVGSNSDMVIDEYYYDPKARSGNIVAAATKGVLRYIGGQISHTSGATITTPSAVLGIRGGIVTVVLPLPPSIAATDPGLAGLRGELIIAHFGMVTVKNNVSQIMLRPGFATVVSSANTPIPAPFRVSDATLQKILQLVTSHARQTGGAASVPTNEAIDLPQGFGATFLADPSHPPGTDPLGYTSIFGAGTSLAKNKSQTIQVQTAPPPPSSSSTPSSSSSTTTTSSSSPSSPPPPPPTRPPGVR